MVPDSALNLHTLSSEGCQSETAIFVRDQGWCTKQTVDKSGLPETRVKIVMKGECQVFVLPLLPNSDALARMQSVKRHQGGSSLLPLRVCLHMRDNLSNVRCACVKPLSHFQ